MAFPFVIYELVHFLSKFSNLHSPAAAVSVVDFNSVLQLIPKPELQPRIRILSLHLWQDVLHLSCYSLNSASVRKLQSGVCLSVFWSSSVLRLFPHTHS